MGQRGAWGAALIAAALLCASPPPSRCSDSALSIVPDPPIPRAGDTVTLTLVPSPSTVTLCSWYRGPTTDVAHEILTLFVNPGPPTTVTGPEYTERESATVDCSLRVRDVGGADSSAYTALIRNPNIATATVTVTVYEPLSAPEVTPSEVTVTEDTNVTLRCHPPNSTVTVGWYRGDAALSPGGRLSLSADNRTLTVTAVQRGDAGLYGCHVANPVSNNRSRDVPVTVVYGPDSVTVTPMGPLDVPVGSALTLECSAPSVPPPELRWLWDGVPVHEGSPWALGNVTVAVAGDVVCHALNPYSGHSRNSSVVTVRVWEPLSAPEVTPSEVTVTEDSNVTLQCHPPNNTVTVGWYRGDAALSHGGRLSLSADNRTLTVTAVQRGDAGLYGCHVANPVSNNRSRDVTVTVVYGPDSASISPPGPLWLSVGAELTLRCSAPSVPPSDVTWRRGNQSLGAGPELHLLLADPAHFGTVHCRATNPVLPLSADAHVELRLDEGLSGGAVAGIVLGSLLGAALIVAGGVLAWKHLHRSPPTSKPPMGSGAAPDANGDSTATADMQYSTIVFPPGGGSAPRPPPAPPSIYAEVKKQ